MKMAKRELEGEVQAEQVATGSKSERVALTLRTLEGSTYILQSPAGSAFGVDPALQGLVGRRVRASGILADQTFIMEDWNFVK
jgi:hypothetical protein